MAMTMTLNRSFATAILSGALVFGGLSVASAHHGDVGEHSTTKGKNIGEIERLERQITAELNRKALTQGAQLAMTTPAPMQEQMPDADEQASLTSDETTDIATLEGEEDAGN